MAKEKINLKPMTIEEIVEAIKEAKPGALGWKVMAMDGDPLPYQGGMLYITETYNVRFKINYGNTKAKRLEKEIYSTTDPLRVGELRKEVDEYNKKYPEYISKGALKTLVEKEEMAHSGQNIPALKAEDTRGAKAKWVHHPDCSHIVTCGNEHQHLMIYPSHQMQIVEPKKAVALPVQVRCFVRTNQGKILEITNVKEAEDALFNARNVARVNAGKPAKATKLADYHQPPAKLLPITKILKIWK